MAKYRVSKKQKSLLSTVLLLAGVGVLIWKWKAVKEWLQKIKGGTPTPPPVK